MFDPRVDYIIAEFKKFNQQFCKKAKCCLGISNTGDPNLVLNQQGDWVIAGGGDIQDLLSDLPEYLGAKEASEDGKPLGYWYYNTFYNNVAKVTEFINRYTAGVSPITFIPDGSNGWHVGIVANPSTVQLPSGQSIDFVNYIIIHYVGGIETINLNGNLTANDTINTGANGAGVYDVNLSYTLLDGSYFSVNCLFVVDSTNNILHSWSNNGTHVNSVNGLVMDLSADIVDTLNMPLTWKAHNGTLNSVGTGKDAVITLPVGTTDIGIAVTLDAVYSDFPDPTYSSGFSVVIS